MNTSNTFRRKAGLIGIGLVLVGAVAFGADQPRDEQNTVELSFPDNLPLKVLIDYVGKRQGVNFIYDESIVNKKVTIKAPRKIPSESLMTLLESALKMKGLVMYPSDVDGMMRIDLAKDLTSISVGPDGTAEAPPRQRPTLAITQVFKLAHATPKRIEEIIKPFLSSQTSNFTSLTEHDLVIITDFADNMPRLERIMALVDQPKRKISIRFIAINHLKAESVAKMAKELISGRTRAHGVETGKTRTSETVTVLAEERTNRVVVICPTDDLEEMLSMIKSLDVPSGLKTEIYKFKFASPRRIDRLVREMIGEFAAERLYNSSIDEDTNVLIVRAATEIHQSVRSITEMLDRPIEDRQSPIRFYKLKNAKVTDVINTLQSIEGAGGIGDVSIDGISPRDKSDSDKIISKGPTEAEVNKYSKLALDGSSNAGAGGGAVELEDARIMADEPTNTIIVIAEPSAQAVYKKLIDRLDVRRPQVLIEATIVTLDTTDGFKLGVEISRSNQIGNDRGDFLTFSSFGLSGVDAGTGRLTLDPGVGFNGALISADIADVVIQALDSDSRANVIARPSVLINDNAEGELIRETEEPFKSINAFTSGTTTESFAGYASAGTRIRLKPQISEGDHLKLEYEVVLSSFSFEEDASESLPPSRQTNSLRSEVTIPDGHTIVVGGLTREEFSNTVDRLPFLGSIPVLEYAFSNRTRDAKETTLFVFIRAVILRDDKFRDLKYLSDDAAREAQLAGDYPFSEPLEVQ